jgi:anti-sigma B factor antagonist
MPQTASSPSVIRLVPPVDAEVLANLRSQATAAVQAGVARLVVDIDSIPVLDTRVIACLIATLRDVRDLGGELVLAVERPSLLETLEVTGLDRVFAIEPPPADQPPPTPPAAPRRRRRSRLATASLMAVALVAGFGGSSHAEGLPTADAIVERVVSANPSLRSYEARVHVAVHMQSFPFLAPRLAGTTYFRRPDNFEVVFDRVPSYAKGFERLYSDIGDPTGWERRFNMTVIGEKSIAGHPDVVLRLVQKVRGMIDHQDVAVDTSAGRIDEMEWHYYNGGVITMTQSFEAAGAYTVLASQHAVVQIPYVHAVADARYDDYRTNVAIDDTVFTKKSK